MEYKTLLDTYNKISKETNWKMGWMRKVCMLSLEYLMLDDGLSSALRASEIPDEIIESINVKENDMDTVYILLGWDDVCMNGNDESEVCGAFSTEELAREAGDELVESGTIKYYTLECPKLDEFGWR